MRDPRSLIIAILMPILMTLLYGYAINLDTKNIRLAILDFDRSGHSRQLSAAFFNSGYFLESSRPASLADPEQTLKSGDASVILTIPPGFSRALGNRTECELGLLIDGADANIATTAGNYSNMIVARFLESQLPPQTVIPGVVMSQQVLFNSDLKSSHFFVPGLVAVILMMISALLTSMTIAREKETGTMEQLLTSPVSPRQIIIGKVAPYMLLALIDSILVLSFAVIVFKVPFTGSVLLLALFGLIYIISALSFGILISTVASTQQVAMMATQLLTVLPSVMLSGYIFEIRNMPRPLQLLTYCIPARYFVTIIRGIMLKGADMTMLWSEAAFLMGLTLVILLVATKKFQLKIG